MSARIYKPANQHTLLWLGFGLAGVAAQLLTMYLLDFVGWTDRLGFWVLLVGGVPFLAILLSGARLLAKFNRERVGEIAVMLERKGFLASPKPSPETRGSFYPSLAGVFAAFGRDRGPDPIQWLALSEPEGSRMAIVEYEYVVGSGKTSREYQLTLSAWPSSHPDFPSALAALPYIALMKYPWWSRGVLLGRDAIKVPGLEAFQKEWIVLGNVDTARRLLTPEVIQFLNQSPKGEFWYLGQGWACVAYAFTMNATNLQRFMEHTRKLLPLLR